LEEHQYHVSQEETITSSVENDPANRLLVKETDFDGDHGCSVQEQHCHYEIPVHDALVVGEDDASGFFVGLDYVVVAFGFVDGAVFDYAEEGDLLALEGVFSDD